MKRESKGQRVKTFKAWIPNADLTKTETQVVVYFQASSGLFSIYDGAHMFLAMADKIKAVTDRRLLMWDTRIATNTLDGVMEGFETICVSYENEMRNAAKKKVIRFTFKRNTSYDGTHPPASDISFCGEPAVHFTYEVLFRVGDKLFWQDTDEGKLQYRGNANEARFREGDAITVDWTAEREAFFENMRQSLVTLIHRVDDFQKNLLVNVDNAIAASSLLLLENKPHDPEA